MRKILSILAIISIIIPFFNVVKVEAASSTYFVVTAYYSPLPNQRFYLKGNYEAEIRLNGRGTHGASGRPVFPGMIAAPKKYGFGTKIQLDGIGTGVVADRGGAIVRAGQRGYKYDRIDIWMGHGEEGLKRALKWGKRTVKGQIVGYDKKSKGSINITKFPSPNSALSRLKQVDSIYSKGIGKKSSNKDILALQSELKSKGIYTGEINGVYNSKMINEIIAYQKKKGIVRTGREYGAGYWGKATRKSVFNETHKGLAEGKTVSNKPNIFGDIFNTKINPKSNKEDVKNLQKLFGKLGKYDGKIDGKYSSIEKPLMAYQKEKGLIKNRDSYGAGYFGPITSKQAYEDYMIVLESEQILAKRTQKAKEIEENARKKVDSHIVKIGNPKLGETSKEVRELQRTLKALGYFDVKDSAIFGNITRNSIMKYQLDKGIIQSRNDKGAGYFGPQTKNAIRQELIAKLKKQMLEKHDLLAFQSK